MQVAGNMQGREVYIDQRCCITLKHRINESFLSKKQKMRVERESDVANLLKIQNWQSGQLGWHVKWIL